MKKYARAAVFLGAFTGPLSGNSILAILPILGTQFHASSTEVLISISFFMFPFATLSLISGSLSDIYGRRMIVAFGFILYGAGALLCALSNDIWTFYAARFIQGFGDAFIVPVLVAIMADIVQAKDRGRNMGYLAAATTTGVATGPILGGVMSIYDWRFAFLLIASMSAISLIAILRTYDGTGFKPSGKGLRSFAINIPKGLSHRGVLIISAIGFLNYFCYIGALAYVSDTLTLPPLGFSETTVGLLVAMTGVSGIIAAPFGGFLVDKIGRGRTASIGLVVVLISFFSLIYANDLISYAFSMALLGIGSQILWAALLTLTIELVPAMSGTISSIFNFSRFMGYAVSPLLLGPIYISSGFDFVLIITSVLIIVGFMMSMLIRKR